MSGRKKGVERKTYIVTAAQASYYENKDGDALPWGGGRVGKAKPHYKFLSGLERYSQDNEAELVIVPIAGKNAREDILHDDLNDRPDIFRGNVLRMNSNLQLRDIVVPPQNVDPTTGKSRLVGKFDSSLIFAHSKQRFLPVAVVNAQLPRYLYTTGAVTLPNYNVANHRGDTAEREHTFGGLVVEVLDDQFYNLRPLRSLKNGKFVDLGVVYDGDNNPVKMTTDTLVLGDIHFGDHDEKTREANYEMIGHFKPKRLVLHDLFNGHSISHHEFNNPLRRIREFKRGRLFLEEELKELYGEVREFSKAMKGGDIFIVSSNHNGFLPKYINSDLWKDQDLWNSGISSYLFSKGVALDLPEEDIDDASFLLEEGLKKFGRIPSNVHFLRLTDDLRRHGYQLAMHGDKGASGSRGGKAKSRAVIGGGKSITGHSHCMELFGDTCIAGTSSKINLPYKAGFGDASIAANVVLYSNGTFQIIPVIEGRWRK